MKTFLVRGLPTSVQTDGWWMSEPPHSKRPDNGAKSQPVFPQLIAVVALVVTGDALLWKASPGLSLALFGMALLLAVWLLNGRRGTGAFGFAALAFLPLVEHAQPLSFAFFFTGLLLSVVWLALGGWPGLARLFGGLWRFVEHAPDAAFSQAKSAANAALSSTPEASVKSAVLSWLVPVGLGLVFASLLVSANPMLSNLLDGILRARWLSTELLARVLFWGGLVILTLPILSSLNMQERLKFTPSPLPELPVPAALNASSICRSLILFNLMFLVQTFLDVTYLWGGASLPDGMSYAQYAHRGAYPLLATALLAGAFALIARPFTSGSSLLRIALLAWVAQNVFLVLSSLLRLELYVAQYGLTHLRISAFIWMVVVALGLVLVVVQTLRNKPASWLLGRAALLGVAALYLASMISFSNTIARHNLGKDLVLDPGYICALGPHALPAIKEFEAKHGFRLCGDAGSINLQVSDWREWGFRDWRLQRSLAALATEETL
ncbi:DUF4173 domain-containing protein [Lentibacter algarum]|uniref:DUF4153 domain-containing protein n=1 Tax=Lentibacter algarum TaxID=576131 RepID=UPI001C07D37B|nr:DUF4173 domain-containing protein [Lentibacter algarum]MBU2980509.1 DUF4173 domain-containing protein [Lentibacter algarum]